MSHGPVDPAAARARLVRLSRLAPAATLALAAVLSVALSAIRLHHAPDDATLEALCAAARRQWRRGDVVIAEPPYIAGVQARLGDLPLLQPRELEPDDLRGYRRAIFVSLDVTGAREDTGRRLFELGSVVFEVREPGGRLRVFALASPEVALVDLWRDIDRARVSLRYAGTASFEPCARLIRHRWLCPRDPEWSFVGRDIRSIANAPRPCVWAHPPLPGGTLRIELPPAAAPSPGARELALELGFIDAVVERARAPVRLRVLAGDTVLWRGERRPSAGMGRARVRLPAGEGLVALELETSYNHGAHFCINATVLAPEDA